MPVSQQQARERYGGIEVASAFPGLVTSVGMVALLPSVLAATGLDLGAATDAGVVPEDHR